MESEPKGLQGKNPLYQRLRGGLNPWRCITQDSEPNTPLTELIGPPPPPPPPLSFVTSLQSWDWGAGTHQCNPGTQWCRCCIQHSDQCPLCPTPSCCCCCCGTGICWYSVQPQPTNSMVLGGEIPVKWLLMFVFIFCCLGYQCKITGLQPLFLQLWIVGLKTSCFNRFCNLCEVWACEGTSWDLLFVWFGCCFGLCIAVKVNISRSVSDVFYKLPSDHRAGIRRANHLLCLILFSYLRLNMGRNKPSFLVFCFVIVVVDMLWLKNLSPILQSTSKILHLDSCDDAEVLKSTGKQLSCLPFPFSMLDWKWQKGSFKIICHSRHAIA